MIATFKTLLWIVFVWTFAALVFGPSNESRLTSTGAVATKGFNSAALGVSCVVALAALGVIEAVRIAKDEIVTALSPTPQPAAKAQSARPGT